jgi:hypothetical protein
MIQFTVFALACFFGWYLNYRSEKFPTTINFHLWFTGLVGMLISAIGLLVGKLLGYWR